MNDNYHDLDGHISHSMLKVFRENRVAFYRRFVRQDMEPPKSTDSTEKGSLGHALALEPDTFGNRYLIVPKLDMRTNADRAIVADAASNGLTVIKQADYDAAREMVDSIMQNEFAEILLSAENSIREKAIRWIDDPTDIHCKSKPDIFLPDRFSVPTCIDLKTSKDPGPDVFGFAVGKFGYHTQAAMYTEGVKHVYGCERVEWYWIAVRNEPPYDCYVHTPDAELMRLGYGLYRAAMNELQDCFISGDWSNVGQRTINEIQPQGWKIRKELNPK